MRNKILFSVLFLLSFFAKSQSDVTMHKLLHVGYVYQNQSFAELGGRLLFLSNDDVVYRIGAAAMLGGAGGKFAVLPKVQGDILLNFERNVDFYHSYYFLGGAEVTSKYFAPKAGVNLLGMLDLTAGYAVPFDKKGINGKQLKGLNINFTLNLPISLIYDLTH